MSTRLMGRILIALGALSMASALAQSVKPVRIGILSANSARTAPFYVAFDRRLRELGWIEGRNVIVQFRTAAADERKFGPLAKELAALHCDVVVAGGPEELLAALKDAVSPTPIVAVALNFDPVRRGYAASLARPGGNITGVSQLATDVEAKRIELLHEALPAARKFALLWDEHTFDQRRSAEDAARRLGLELVLIENRPPYDYDAIFAQVRKAGIPGLVAVPSPRMARDRKAIASAAVKQRVLVISAPFEEQLLAFGPRNEDAFARAAEYVDRILRGAKPSEMPIEQPNTFELVIDLRQAKTIGIELPQSLRLRANRVIE